MADRDTLTEVEAATELLLHGLEEEFDIAISDELTEDEQTRAQIEQHLAVELRDKVAKNGSIMAYREECKRDAVRRLLALPETDITDLGRLAGLQMAVAKFISVEKFIQANIAGVGTLVKSGGAVDDFDGDAVADQAE